MDCDVRKLPASTLRDSNMCTPSGFYTLSP